MFNHEEMVVLCEIGAGSLADCKAALAKNLAMVDDQFAKEFLAQLIAQVETLSEREYRAAMKAGRGSRRWWE